MLQVDEEAVETCASGDLNHGGGGREFDAECLQFSSVWKESFLSY